MNCLFLNTACKNAEVLLLCDNSVFYEQCGEKMQATANLLPTIDRVLEKSGISLNDIDIFSAVSGPGSFTGIRVGITTIRAFAYALSKPCIMLDYFDILMQNADPSIENIVLIIDGGNKMKYIAVRDVSGKTLLNPKYVDNETLKTFLSEIEEPYSIISDSDIDIVNVIVRPSNGKDFIFAAEKSVEKNKRISYNELIPLYVAKSQAERDKGL